MCAADGISNEFWQCDRSGFIDVLEKSGVFRWDFGLDWTVWFVGLIVESAKVIRFAAIITHHIIFLKKWVNFMVNKDYYLFIKFC
jgi:hypothetical protein